MPRSKKENLLTLESLVKDTDKYNKLIKVEFEDGRYTQIYAHFSPTRIDTMLEDYSLFVNEYIKTVGEIKESRLADYLNMHILLHFSKITDQGPLNFEEKIIILDKILDSELAEQIFNAFSKEELKKVYDRVWKKFNVYKELIDSNVELKEEFEKQMADLNLKNPEIIKTLLKDKSGSNEKI